MTPNATNGRLATLKVVLYDAEIRKHAFSFDRRGPFEKGTIFNIDEVSCCYVERFLGFGPILYGVIACDLYVSQARHPEGHNAEYPGR